MAVIFGFVVGYAIGVIFPLSTGVVTFLKNAGSKIPFIGSYIK